MQLFSWVIRSWQSIQTRNESMMYCRMSPTHKSATAQTRSFFVLLVSEILIVCLVTIGGSFSELAGNNVASGRSWAQNVWCRVPNVMCRRSFCFATAPTMWSTRKTGGKWAAIRYTTDHIFDYIEIDDPARYF